MNGVKKSDGAILPSKRANKGTGVPAEPVEGRASAKGNPRSESTRRTQSRESVTQAAGRIRQAATRKPQEKLTALLHHVTPDALRWAFHALKRDAAAGVDGMTWALYAEGLEERLLDLHRRVQSGAYRAPERNRRRRECGRQGGRRPQDQEHPLLGFRVGRGQARGACPRHPGGRVRSRAHSDARPEPGERRFGPGSAVDGAADRADVPLHLVPGDRKTGRDAPRGAVAAGRGCSAPRIVIRGRRRCGAVWPACMGPPAVTGV